MKKNFKRQYKKIKRQVKKSWHYILRKIARFILGFERCPIDNRKDYKGILFDASLAMLIVIMSGLVFAGMFLIFN